jgi:serine/threonine protein kinase
MDDDDPPSKEPRRSSPSRKLLTSEDLFGDVVDAPAPKQARSDAGPARQGPIRVRVREQAEKPGTPGVAEELAALLDAIPDPATQEVGRSEAATPEPERAPRPASHTRETPTSADFEPLPALLEDSGPRVPRDATPPPPAPETAGSVGPDESPPAAMVYGPYELLEKVAVGGMAEVFKAKRKGVEGFEKVVAVKRILGHLSANKEFVDMFIDEAKMVAGLAHPNIVHIHDLGRINRSYYIAMEYVHGRDLRSILRRVRERGLQMPIDLGLLIASKVASGLEHAHAARNEDGRPMRIVHRDVSPQNILISFEGEVKLTDFGIAKAATKASTTERGALRGKLMYMSPEQASGMAMDHRSDLFSLGIVLYEMLTDQKPFTGGSDMSLLETVRQCHVSPPSSLNPRVGEKIERVVMKALRRDPEDRHRDAGALVRDLERLIQESHPATSKDLARFLQILFDKTERGGVAGDETPASLNASRHADPGGPR